MPRSLEGGRFPRLLRQSAPVDQQNFYAILAGSCEVRRPLQQLTWDGREMAWNKGDLALFQYVFDVTTYGYIGVHATLRYIVATIGSSSSISVSFRPERAQQSSQIRLNKNTSSKKGAHIKGHKALSVINLILLLIISHFLDLFPYAEPLPF